MARLTIHLLGPVQVTLDGQPIAGFETEKGRASLAYLAAEPDRTHRREALAEMFWPGRAEGAARANLRHTLARLRQVIGDRGAEPPFLVPTRHTIRLNGSTDAWIDVAAFSALLPGHQPIGPATNPHTVHQLEAAVRLYRGPFLEDLSLPDSADFEEWRVLRREQFGRLAFEALYRLAEAYERDGDYERALAHAWRQVELEPWEEAAQEQVMRLLALTGRRAEALAQYEAYRCLLAAELGIEPSAETARLFERIRRGQLQRPAGVPVLVQKPEPALRRPAFLEQEAAAAERPVFVARERELARLDTFLHEALAGHGQVVFVTGGSGRGKTALLAEFGRQAMQAHPDLLVASGTCNAYGGVGDPYLPFREVMAALTGEVEARWQAGAITTDHARRLWNTFPDAIYALLQHGPHVTRVLVPGQALLSRAERWCAATTAGPHDVPWLHQLRARVEHRQAAAEGPEQTYLFQQVTNVLRALAASHPLLLILDDLQWADVASIGVLFHLGRRLEGARILVAGAYRPVEVRLGRPSTGSGQVERHPLEKVLSEFKRAYGDVWLDLADVEEPERRRFIDALLEAEPNRLGEDFRRELVRHTGGHPLFTVELLRAMQARGDLIRDGAGRWTEGPVLDWETLPARVEGVIEERVARLEPELRDILSVASVEGEGFHVAVVAQVQGVDESVLLRRLAGELERRHRLVAEQAEVQTGAQRTYRYKFGHIVVQNYLYRQLSQGERRLLHGKVAAALEDCYGEQADQFAVNLAHHYHRAGDDGRALLYFTRAAENAGRVYAYDEAYAHYTRALEAARRVSADATTMTGLHLGRGLVCETLGDFEGALADYESALQLACTAGECDAGLLAWRALLRLGRLWASRDYTCAHDYLREALELAYHMGDPAVLAESLNWMGNWYLNAEDPTSAIARHRQALQIFQQLGDRRDLATTLDLLGIASLLGADVTASVGYYDQAIALFRELDDRPGLASSLTGRGHAGGTTYTSLSMVPPAKPIEPRRDFEEALRITREIGSPAGEAWVLWSLGLLHLAQGRYGQALEVARGSLDVAIQIEHREWIVGSRCMLGVLYVELLAPEEARRQLEPALALAQELQSRHWIHHASGVLAAAHCLLDERAQARAYLETVLSPGTPMDTLHKRYCWARRAELALCQGDPALALDIVERLIASAPGMSPGRVITFLWKLKGEASAAMGRLDEAGSLLHAALENARLTRERFLLWRLHASLGWLYRTTDRPTEADDEFSTARALIQELAGTVPDEALRDQFLRRAYRALGATPWPRCTLA
jgi:adenylate cyclase